MAKTSFVSVSGCTSDAAFRTLGLLISGALEAVGLIKTADTGQIDWGTVTKPTTTYAVAGYEIRTFPAGTLQTANPLIVKVNYGSTNNSANVMGIQIQVGHATDGAGNFTGDYSDTYSLYPSSSNSNGAQCYVSCDTEHLTIALFLGISGTTTNYSIVCSMDRLRDSDGVALDTGVNILTMYSGYFGQRMLPATGAQFPSSALTQPMALFPGGSGAQTVVGKNICFSNVYPYLGCTGNPDMNAVVYPAGNMPINGGVVIQFPVYGVLHDYVLVGPYVGTYGGNTTAQWGLGVRYE